MLRAALPASFRMLMLFCYRVVSSMALRCARPGAGAGALALLVA